MQRIEFEMSEEDLTTLMDASKPVMAIALNCDPARSQQENANNAWEQLGKKLGFDHMTVQPSGKGDRFFTAEASAGT